MARLSWFAGLALVAGAMAEDGARYVYAGGAARASGVAGFTASRTGRWETLHAVKAGGGECRVWLEKDGQQVLRYLVQEGTGPAQEYRHGVTGRAVTPMVGGWQHLWPFRAATWPDEIEYLGHRYRRESLQTVPGPELPQNIKTVELRPDLWIGPASNTRQKDERRRYDTSDYELVRFTRADYAEMAAAGVTCVRVDDEQAPWADELGLFYWGATNKLPYPEMLYRSQYLGAALYLDEPAVGTRDHVMRPRLDKDPALRKSVSPQTMVTAFGEHFREAAQRNSFALMKRLAARADVDLGTMNFPQQNLYSWETMISTAAYQLSRDPRVPSAFVFEPPGRIGTRRTLPEMNINYGTQFAADDQRALIDIIIAFLRGAARLAGKEWGISIYGAVEKADSFWWLTHAYDLGATRFFFWDNYQLACVPYGEVLTLTRHLRTHARQHPRSDLARLRQAAEVAILLPPGYDLGHVQMGKGSLWGTPELNLERTNAGGVKYRRVMSNFFQEAERCLRLGVSFDALWDLPDVTAKGYREVVRVREDGRVEIAAGGRKTTRDSARQVERAAGAPPKLTVTASADGRVVRAVARVEETAAPVFYTTGADPEGVYRNAMVFWELYGPGEEDYSYVQADRMQPVVSQTTQGLEVEMTAKVARAGRYRVRAGTVDLAGRSTVVWTDVDVR